MKVVLVSLSNGLGDPRPFRLAQILASAGHDVKQIGYASKEVAPKIRNWEYLEISPSAAKVSRLEFYIGRLIMVFGPSKFAAKIWLKRLLPVELRAKLEKHPADCYVAMDYALLPLLSEFSDRHQAKLCYEAREYYQGQNNSNVLWMKFMPRVVRRIEGTFIQKCSIITTVSKGISELLFQDYGLLKHPEVVFGFQDEEFQTSNVRSRSWRLLFHGNISSDREVDRFIKYFDFEEAKSTLTVRGNGSLKYINVLQELISRKNYLEVVRYNKAVPRSELIKASTSYDFGLIPWRNSHPQKRYSMPNKFFEYLTAGLPIICTDDSEISDLVKEYEIGLVFTYQQIELLVSKLRELNDSDYELMKENVSKFVADFGFAEQSKKLLEIYSKLSH